MLFKISELRAGFLQMLKITQRFVQYVCLIINTKKIFIRFLYIHELSSTFFHDKVFDESIKPSNRDETLIIMFLIIFQTNFHWTKFNVASDTYTISFKNLWIAIFKILCGNQSLSYYLIGSVKVADIT